MRNVRCCAWSGFGGTAKLSRRREVRTLSKHAVVLVNAIGSPMQRLDYTFYIVSITPQRQHAEQFTGCFGRSFRQMHDHNIWLSIKLWRIVCCRCHTILTERVPSKRFLHSKGALAISDKVFRSKRPALRMCPCVDCIQASTT